MLLFVLAIPYSNCSPKHEQGEALSSFNAAEALNSLQSRSLEVLQAKCATCHVANYALSDLKNVLDVTYLSDSGFINPGSPQTSPLYLSLIDGTEPPIGSPDITDNDIAILRDWIAALGGNFNTLIGSTDGQTGGVPGVAGTYSQVNAILAQRCNSCHSGQRPPTLNVSYAQLIGATTRDGARVVTPSNINLSRLYQSVVANAMPQGGNPLTTQQKETIRSWIAAGAMNN